MTGFNDRRANRPAVDRDAAASHAGSSQTAASHAATSHAARRDNANRGTANGAVWTLVSLAAALTTLVVAACTDPESSPQQGGADAGGQNVFADVPVLAEGAQADPAQEAKNVERIEAGEDFIDIAFRPNVQFASQQVANSVHMALDSMRVPLAGNEHLLDLNLGSPFVGAAVEPAERAMTGSNNVFGFARLVKSVQIEGDQIVIETERATLVDIVSGGLHISQAAETAEPIDTTGVELGDYFHGWNEDFVPVQPDSGFDQVGGPIGVDLTYNKK